MEVESAAHESRLRHRVIADLIDQVTDVTLEWLNRGRKAVGIGPDDGRLDDRNRPPALVDEPMMKPAQTHEIVEPGVSPSAQCTT